MEISDGYRTTRRNTSFFGGLSIAWSAAQFDLKHLEIPSFGDVDISAASIPIILVCLTVYSFVRCTIDYMMQQKEIRCWNMAQVDYKITLNLVRISLLAIATSTASRSISSLVGVVGVAIYFLFGMGITFPFIPVIKKIRVHLSYLLNFHLGVNPSIIEAILLSVMSMIIIFAVLFIQQTTTFYNDVTPFKYLPTIQGKVPTIVFSITAILIIISFCFEELVLKKVFAIEIRPIAEWNEALRLLHIFCPESKSLIHSRKDLHVDNICKVMAQIDSKSPEPRILIDCNRGSLENFRKYFDDQIKSEVGRVLVIPDLGWSSEKPFVCSIDRLYQRIIDGADAYNFIYKSDWELIDGCSDVLFVFETSGKLLLFDHHEGFTQATPDKWKK